MPIVPATRYSVRTAQKSKKPRHFKAFFLALLLAISVAGACNYVRPLPPAIVTVNVKSPTTSTVTLAWPSYSQASVAAKGYGLLGTHGAQTPLATASIAKVITALCVLDKAPLKLNETGPTYTISSKDMSIYTDYVAQNGSVLTVVEGDTLTEYQALQALMIPSANNIADSLVMWVFGSHEAYTSYATSYLQKHGIMQTQIGSDASGLDASTVSTANDLAIVGELALDQPVLMQIAGQRTATFATAGTVYNYNTILGQQGITGLKTGNNEEDPGAFAFTATTRVGGKDILLTGAVMGAPDLPTALADTTKLVATAQTGFEETNIAKPAQVVGTLDTAWGAHAKIRVHNAVALARWKSTPITITHSADASVRSGKIGTLKAAAGKVHATTDITLDRTVVGPSFWWRLTRH